MLVLRIRFLSFFILFNVLGAALHAQPLPTPAATQTPAPPPLDFKETYKTSTLSAKDVIGWLPGELRPIASFEIIQGYPVWRVVILVLLLTVGFFFSKILGAVIKRYSERLERKTGGSKRAFIRSFILSLRRPVRVLAWAGFIRLAGFLLDPEHASAAVWLASVFINIALVVFVYDFVGVIEVFLTKRAVKTNTRLDDMLVPLVKRILKVGVIIFASIQLFQSISGQSVATIIGGLGIAGIAVAFSAQDTIKNFFGFLMIVLDKPFAIGDRIVFDGHDGTVEEVGLRSVKLRRLDGHHVTIPNSKVVDSATHNIGRRPFIQRIMNIGITYNTPPEKVERALAIVKEILADHEGLNPEYPPRVYFNDFSDSSLNLFVIYWYHPPAYWDYMAHAERVNMEILKRFNAEGIEFAFPSRTVYLADPGRAKDMFGPPEPYKGQESRTGKGDEY